MNANLDVKRWVHFGCASTITASVIVLGAGLLGCAATGASVVKATSTGSAHHRLAPDVDASRAFLPLSRIVPGVAAPRPRADLPPLSERAATHLARARSLIAEQRFTEATIALDRALRFEPKHPAVHAALAALHWALGNTERARTHAERAIEGNADMAEAQYILGRIALSRGEFDAAIQRLRRTLLCSDLSASPALEGQTNYYLGEALAGAGYLEAAIGAYRSFVDAPHGFDRDAAVGAGEVPGPAERRAARTAMATLLEKLGRVSEAADVLAPLAAATETDPEIVMRYARLLIDADRFDEALATARLLPAADDGTLDLLAELYRHSGHPERFIDELRARVNDQPGESRLSVRLADELSAVGRSEDAMTVLRSFLGREPGAHTVRLKLVDHLVAAKRFGAALDEMATGVVLASAPLRAYEQLVARLGSNPAAVEMLLDDRHVTETVSAPSLYLLGVLARQAGRHDEAERLLTRAVEQDEDFTAARARLAEILLETFRFDEAIRVASRGHDEVPSDPRLALVLGRAYEHLDDTQRAELHLRAVTQQDRENVEAMLELAKVYRRSGRSNLAQRQLQVLLERAPSFDPARELLAVMYMKDGKLDEAFAQVREMKRRTESPLVEARCDTLLDPELRRNGPARRTALQKAIDKFGGDAVTWIAVAETYDGFEASPRRDAYLHALEHDPTNEDALWGLVHVEQRLLAFEASARYLEELLRLRPNRDAWRLALLDAYSVIGADEKILAMTQAQEARSGIETSRRRDYRARTIEALRRLGRDDEVLPTLEGWAHADPDTPMWGLWLADEYLERGQPDRAVAIYQGQYASRPQDWGALASFADALVKAGHADRAAQYVLDRLNEDPDNDQGTWMLAGVMSDAGDGDAAIELIANRLQRTRKREAFQDLLIDRYRAAHRPGDAIALIESLMEEVVSLMRRVGGGGRAGVNPFADGDIARQPDEPISAESLVARLAVLRIRLGLALIADKQYRVAEERVTDWLEGARESNDRGRLLGLLAACQRARGAETRANETLRRALSIHPENVSLNNDVSYSLIDEGIELDQAERMIRFAVWRSPGQPAYLDTYGWLLYKQKKFAEALKWTKRALRNQRKPDAVILDHLGDIAWRLGDRDGALAFWSRAVERIGALGSDEEQRSADERRVRHETGAKIKAVRSGAEPAVAPLGRPSASQEHKDEKETEAPVGTKL